VGIREGEKRWYWRGASALDWMSFALCNDLNRDRRTRLVHHLGLEEPLAHLQRSVRGLDIVTAVELSCVSEERHN